MPHWRVAYGKVPTVNPSVTATPCQLPLAREPLRAVPADNFPRESSVNRYCPSSARYRRLVRRTYSLFTLHYSLKTPGIGGLPKPPGLLRGCLGTAEAGGFRGQGHGTSYRFPLPYSLNFPCSPGKGGFFRLWVFENFVNLKKNNHQKKDWG